MKYPILRKCIRLATALPAIGKPGLLALLDLRGRALAHLAVLLHLALRGPQQGFPPRLVQVLEIGSDVNTWTFFFYFLLPCSKNVAENL